MELTITKAAKGKPHPDDAELAFGTVFTDHMFNMDYTRERGWHNPRIEPYGPFTLSPAAMVLHYGQAIFEGLKAFRTESGGVQMFRPEQNLARLNASARRLCIPAFDEDALMGYLKQLIALDRDWVPAAHGTSLYVRPFIFATDPYVGLRSSYTYRFAIILCPVGAYYPEGFDPVKIWVTRDYVRAVRGGVGDVKTAGNYAASLYATDLAHEEGYTQVLWLDGVEQKYVEEVGSMNIFFVINDELVTPALHGSILPGITRDSVIALARKWGMPVSERRISIDEVFEAGKNGSLTEVFGSGTAAAISPVGVIKCGDEMLTVGDGNAGPMSKKFYQAITDIQYGKAEDTDGWITPVS
ncbi:MAG: branched-chain amino acid aminotransferase [Thermodesulfobacteriota bacterium]|nr:branched-chain amino acid aminotransferase [Thermodesulfobacteriota bacterium]